MSIASNAARNNLPTACVPTLPTYCITRRRRTGDGAYDWPVLIRSDWLALCRKDPILHNWLCLSLPLSPSITHSLTHSTHLTSPASLQSNSSRKTHTPNPRLHETLDHPRPPSTKKKQTPNPPIELDPADHYYVQRCGLSVRSPFPSPLLELFWSVTPIRLFLCYLRNPANRTSSASRPGHAATLLHSLRSWP